MLLFWVSGPVCSSSVAACVSRWSGFCSQRCSPQTANAVSSHMALFDKGHKHSKLNPAALRVILANSQEKRHDVEFMPTWTPLGETSLLQFLFSKFEFCKGNRKYALICRCEIALQHLRGIEGPITVIFDIQCRKEDSFYKRLGSNVHMLETRKYIKQTPLFSRCQSRCPAVTRVRPRLHIHASPHWSLW